ncbi:MAG: class I SAM-dependent methyltransferase, partial [Deltaproteobacteria bacterium]|nr:class I SAM-dependent methyltransferase [Deltaproteobacteria bacterium]
MIVKKCDKYHSVKVFHDNAELYDSWFEDSLIYEIELAALKGLNSQLHRPKLEIGVGPGRFAGDLDIDFGTDPAWAPLILASGRKIKCCQAFGEQLPVQDSTIGAIYILFTLCFTADPQKVLAECSRVLKESGLLVIGMIPSGSVWGRSLASKKETDHPFYRHASFYTIEKLTKWLG